MSANKSYIIFTINLTIAAFYKKQNEEKSCYATTKDGQVKIYLSKFSLKTARIAKE